MPNIDVAEVKRESEAIIRRHGGQICDWLPSHDPESRPRSIQEVARRALILNALIQLIFSAPIPVVKSWIATSGLENDLTKNERAILEKANASLTEQQRINLYWHIEALWALAWAGGLIPEMPINVPVGNNLASFYPNLKRNENGTKFIGSMTLRAHEELFRMLDLYYRAHWWTRNAKLKGQETSEVSIDIIMERRKALQWIWYADEDWDEMTLDT